MESKMKWNVATRIDKYATHQDYLDGIVEEVDYIDGNVALTDGVTDLWRLFAGQKNDIMGPGQVGLDKRRLKSFVAGENPFLTVDPQNNLGSGDNHLHYDEAHSYIGVGSGGDYQNINDVGDRTLLGLRGEDSTTQGDSHRVCYKAVDEGFPKVNGRTITFKAAYYGGNTPAPNTIPDGQGQAAFQWNEWTVARGKFHGFAADLPDPYTNDNNYDRLASTDSANAHCIEHNLNRKVEEMGTKHALATWVITVEISLS